MDVSVYQCWKTKQPSTNRIGPCMCNVTVTRVCIVGVLVASCECVKEGAEAHAVAQPGLQVCCQFELM